MKRTCWTCRYRGERIKDKVMLDIIDPKNTDKTKAWYPCKIVGFIAYVTRNFRCSEWRKRK